jgi:transcriptional regulator with XRE-family HTH domain
MAFSLGRRLRATRESLELTQEQVIEQMETCFGIVLSQQAISHIEHGKRKIDAERELPAFAALYGKPIDYFYEKVAITSVSSPSLKMQICPVVKVDLAALTHRDKLELAADLIHNVLKETQVNN